MITPAQAGTTVFAEKSVLVTGGAGAFGRAFTARALQDGARRVVVFSRDEAKHALMAITNPDPRVRYFIGDVRDESRLRMALHKIDYVVHAAALKRVDTCEADPHEAIKTNVVGSTNVVTASIDAGVKRAIILSTDKAAAPSTLYGMTKAVAERAWVQANGYADGTHTRFAATRYGNVLGSTGSILPLWEQQLYRGEPLTITDVRATRFWMSMDAAVDLVARAFRDMTGGETFVPKIGAASLQQLCIAFCLSRHLPTFTPRITALRAGEKLHETLISVDESVRTFERDPYYIIAPSAPTWTTRDWSSLYPATGNNFSLRSDTTPHKLPIPELTQLISSALPPTHHL